MKPIKLFPVIVLIFSLGCQPVATSPTNNISTQIPETFTVTLSPTPIPTFLPEETERIALIWLRDNNDCRLPCLLGITPGVTSVQERQAHFAWFGKIEKPGFSTGLGDHAEYGLGIRNMFFNERDVEATVSVTYHEKNGFVEQMDLSANVTREHQEVFGDPLLNKIMQYYLLPQLLSNYGPPSSILIGAWHDDPFLKAPYTEFSTVLVYYDLGFMVEYISPSEFTDNVIRGCPLQSYLNLWAWSPKEKPSLAEILSRKVGDTGIFPLSIDYFKSIEQATSFTVQNFYETFKNPENIECLETSSDLWPNPNNP